MSYLHAGSSWIISRPTSPTPNPLAPPMGVTRLQLPQHQIRIAVPPDHHIRRLGFQVCLRVWGFSMPTLRSKPFTIPFRLALTVLPLPPIFIAPLYDVDVNCLGQAGAAPCPLAQPSPALLAPSSCPCSAEP